jgi:predicted DNA-binding protein (UPF0251 family)
MQEVNNVQRIIKEAVIAFKNQDASKLKNLSNQTVHTATLTQDTDNIITAVMIYALGKIIERENYRKINGWEQFYTDSLKQLELASQNIEKKDISAYRLNLGKIRNVSNKIDSNLGDYIQDVFYRSEVKKAFRLYEHGLSFQKTAELLGVSAWDLASYIGNTSISESSISETMSVKKRIKNLEKYFNSKQKLFFILDTGPLISLTMNSLLPMIEKIRELNPEVEFVITPQVKKEIIDRPMRIKKYEFEALRVQDLLDRKIIKLATEFIDASKLNALSTKYRNLASNLIKVRGRGVDLVQDGESSCLAFAKLINKQSIIVIDERTTRLLTESPENLDKLMERKLKTDIHINKSKLKDFQGFEFIRSTELIYLAFKNGLFKLKNTKALLGAILYALKYSGTGITSNEINALQNLV